MTEDSEERSTELLLEQYKLYVEMTDRTSARRAEMNKFYISVLAGLLAVVSVVIEKSIFANAQDMVFIAIALLAILLCVVWTVNIRSYRQLNSIKFNVIHEMEKDLPFSCYGREWGILQNDKNGKSYLRLTLVEQFVPILLTVPYLVLLAYSVIH